MKILEEKSLVLWIPASIFGDPRLCGNAKLVLAEIFNLLKQNRQHCWASNEHFAEMFGMGKDHAAKAKVSYYIKQLEKTGWIKSKPVKECNLDYCTLKESGWHRHIFAGIPLSNIFDSLSKKPTYPIKKNSIGYQNAEAYKSNIESNSEKEIKNKENLKKIEKIKEETRKRFKGKIFK